MARKTLCPVCNISFDRDLESFIYYKNRYYHESCYKTVEIQKKKKVNKDEVEESKKILFDYLKVLFKSDKVSPLICKQINDLVKDKEKKYTYGGIYKTLYYFFEVRGNGTGKANGIGIVPFVYDEAKEYFFNIFKMEQFNKNITEAVTSVSEVVIKQPERKPYLGGRKILTMEDIDE